MDRLRLDFQRDGPPGGRAPLVLALTGMVVLVLLVLHGRLTEAQAVAVEAQVRRVEAASRPARLPASGAAAKAQAQEVQQANQVVRELTLPWSALFRAVDAAGGKDVALLMLEPDLRKGTVRISGEARNLPAVLDYVRTLSQGEGLGAVLLESHQVRQDEAEKPVRFTLAARWKEAAP